MDLQDIYYIRLLYQNQEMSQPYLIHRNKHSRRQPKNTEAMPLTPPALSGKKKI